MHKYKIYRSKPVVIRAVQWTGHYDDDILTLDCFSSSHADIEKTFIYTDDNKLKVNNSYGLIITANIGDWIIIGENGEVAVCKDTAFRRKYEEVVSIMPIKTKSLS